MLSNAMFYLLWKIILDPFLCGSARPRSQEQDGWAVGWNWIFCSEHVSRFRGIVCPSGPFWRAYREVILMSLQGGQEQDGGDEGVKGWPFWLASDRPGPKSRMEGLGEANEDRNFRGLDSCHNFMYYLEYKTLLYKALRFGFCKVRTVPLKSSQI